jgi:hypothetical protein
MGGEIDDSQDFVMSEIISLIERKRDRLTRSVQIIEKVVDGKIIKCVNIDTLPPSLLPHFLADEDTK